MALPNRRLVGISSACLLAGLFLAGCGPSDQGTTAGSGSSTANESQIVEVSPVSRRDMIEALTVVGSLAANESAEIRPEIAGLIQQIYFEEGQTVKKGDVLLKIDDEELRAQYAQVEARFKLAELNVARSDTLSGSKTIPQSEADRARSEFAGSKAELALLRTRLEKTDVKAPFDGVVGARVISPGDYVNTQTVITTLNDLSRLKVEFQVPEQSLGKISPGTTFVIRSRALAADDEIKGEVYFVSAIIDRATRSSEVKGFLEKPPPVLKPGMFANIELVLGVRRDVLTVAEGAILISAGGAQVVVVQEKDGRNVADFVRVELGMRTHGLVEVKPLDGNLTEGQQVVASGVGALVLYPGELLDPKPLRQEFRVGE